MAQRKRPTERTPQSGIEVPIPKRGEFFGNLKKVAKAGGRKPGKGERRPK